MGMDPRILVVTETLGFGGTEFHLLAVLPRIAARGFKIVVFCLTERGVRADALERAGIQVVASPRISETKRSPLRYPLHLTFASAKLFNLARKWQPDIAHFFLPAPYLIGAPIAKVVGVPIRILSRRSLTYYHRNWRGSRTMERVLHRQMAAITGNCRAVLHELVEEGVPEQKLRLMYNGIEATGPKLDRLAARAELGLDPDCLVGVTVANLIPYKGHEDLLEGLAIAAPQMPVPWKFLCVGRDDGRQAALSALAEKRGIGGNVEFLGPRIDVDRILAAADFSVLPSRDNEGFSNAILELMNAGLPMVVTDVGGNAEAVINDETGFVVSAFDPEALASGILRLARDPALRARLGDAGLTRLKTTFTLDRSVSAYCELYANLLKSTGLA